MTNKTCIRNMPCDWAEKKHIVARCDNNGRWWFWGAWPENKGDAAYTVARNIDGRVFDVSEITEQENP